jgi:hypothetical protein
MFVLTLAALFSPPVGQMQIVVDDSITEITIVKKGVKECLKHRKNFFRQI